MPEIGKPSIAFLLQFVQQTQSDRPQSLVQPSGVDNLSKVYCEECKHKHNFQIEGKKSKLDLNYFMVTLFNRSTVGSVIDPDTHFTHYLL